MTPGRVAQSVACPSADACLSWLQIQGSRVRSHTFVEIDHEIIFTVILLPSAESIRVVVG